jgi:hypothetical protein
MSPFMHGDVVNKHGEVFGHMYNYISALTQQEVSLTHDPTSTSSAFLYR